MSRPAVHETCTIKGCSKPHVGRGWCGMHYDRWRRHGDPNARPKVKHVGCSVEGCDRKHASHGYCAMHGQAWRKYGDPTAGKRQIRDAGCQMPGCRNPHKALGMCVMHYHRWKACGDPYFDGKNFPVCKAGECLNDVTAKGYCLSHYDRWRKYGDPLKDSGRIEPIGVRLDVLPLLVLVEKRGGIGASLDAAGIYHPTERNRYEVSLMRAGKRGYIDAATGDDWVIRVYGMHPCFVWGDDWWSEEITEAEQELEEAA